MTRNPEVWHSSKRLIKGSALSLALLLGGCKVSTESSATPTPTTPTTLPSPTSTEVLPPPTSTMQATTTTEAKRLRITPQQPSDLVLQKLATAAVRVQVPPALINQANLLGGCTGYQYNSVVGPVIVTANACQIREQDRQYCQDLITEPMINMVYLAGSSQPLAIASMQQFLLCKRPDIRTLRPANPANLTAALAHGSAPLRGDTAITYGFYNNVPTSITSVYLGQDGEYATYLSPNTTDCRRSLKGGAVANLSGQATATALDLSVITPTSDFIVKWGLDQSLLNTPSCLQIGGLASLADELVSYQ
jgi:hypothetical protein